MASNGTGQRPGSSSFLSYMVGQHAKSGRGLMEIDAAVSQAMPSANEGAPAQATPEAAMPVSPNVDSPPLTLDGPELTETQTPALRLLDQDRFYRDYGRLPTSAELAADQFSKQVMEREGRAPTKAETVAHIYRRADKLPQVSSDYEV